jgi:hypothetical protein
MRVGSGAYRVDGEDYEGVGNLRNKCLSLEKVDSLKAKRDVKLSNIEKRDVL